MREYPTDYRWLQDSGTLERLTNPMHDLLVWDVEFMLQIDVEQFTRLDDQIIDITPFARSANGDYWAYVSHELPSQRIVRCYRDSYFGDRIADSLAELVFMQTVFMAGTEVLNTDSAWTVEEMVGNIRNVRSAFAQLFTSVMLKHLDDIVEANGRPPGSKTLIEGTLASKIVADIVPAYALGEELEWRG